MAGSTRGELASSGLEGSAFVAAYQNGQRGAFSASTLDKSGGFRETLDARAMVSGTGTSRNVASPVELSPVSNYLQLEPFSMSEQKFSRQGEIRRALGIPVEEHAFGSLQSKSLPHLSVDDVKRLKASLTESMSKARDRAKIFHESIMKVDKYRNMLLRKRKADLLTDKSSSSNVVKIGQNHQTSADLVTQRLEDRAKNVVPNKRVRSSMAEVRSEGRCTVPPRQGAVVEKEKSILFDKDKNILRGCNGPTDEKMRVLPPGSDGWEKKLKRKRSVGTMVSRGIDGDREVKPPSQQRPSSDPRPRSSDGNGFRPGSSSGILGSNKTDGSCGTGGNARVMPRNDLESSSLSNEKRERFAGVDKERVISKGGNKLTIREDVHLGNQSPLIKGKASRAPRSGSGVLMNTSSNLPRSAGGLDGWEQASSLNKVQASPGVPNRKRPVPTGSSSPPVTQWIGQRPQKISRTRRANVVSPVSNLDESQFLPEGFGTPDVGRLTTVDASGLLISKGIPTTAHQSKLKDSAPSPAGLSESEESGAVDNKSKEKGVNNVESEDASPSASIKPTSFVFPTKKNKISIKEDIGDGVRRQGRSGRGSTQSKAILPSPKEKTESPDMTKPVKNGKNGSDRSESRIGRPPSKKMSDRKTHNRTGNIINGGSSDLTGDSDDDREELQAAALSARNASYNASSASFWKKMEPYFAFLTSEDISYVKNQIHFAEELDASLSGNPCADQDGEVISEGVSSPRSSLLIGQVRDNAARPFGPVPSSDLPQTMQTEAGKFGTNILFEKMIPLSQMLLSAFITEDEAEKFDYNSETKTFSHPPNGCCSYDTSAHTEKKDSKSYIKSEFDVALDYKHHLGDNIPCNGFLNSSNSRHSDTQAFMSGDESLMENSPAMHLDNGYLSEYKEANINMQQQNTDNITPHGSQFELMSLSDRVLMELHSIGLFPETVPELAEDDSGDIDKEIAELKMRLCHQVKRRKLHLDKLDKAIQDAKEIEERNLECLAVNKLVEMACKKLMGGRGGSNHKSNKISKQLAMSFANRTLARCRKFEETGRSCFSEPALWDVLTTTINTNHGISTNVTDRHGLGNKLDRGSTDSYHSQIPDPSLVKNELISSRGKKKEVLLDDVTSGASRSMSTPNTIPSGAKWKRTERDRDQNREGLARNSNVKAGRPSLSSRGERKTKTKPKQKIAELSSSGNGLGRITETTNFASPSLRECSETVNNGISQEVDMAHDSSKEINEAIFTNLPLHGIDPIDELDVAEGLDGQGQDLATWLNVVDDDILLQDHDLVGLQIPMDDLSDIKLSF